LKGAVLIKRLALLAITLTILLSFPVSMASANLDYIPYIRESHQPEIHALNASWLVDVKRTCLVVINQTYFFNSSILAGVFRFSIPLIFRNRIYGIQAFNPLGEKLPVQTMENDYLSIVIYASNLLDGNYSYLNVTFALANVINCTGQDNFEGILPLGPILEYNLSRYTCTIKFAPDVTSQSSNVTEFSKTTIGGMPALNYSCRSFNALSSPVYSIRYTSPLSAKLVITKMIRRVSIDPLSGVHVRDEIYIEHYGGNFVDKRTFHLPPGTRDIYVFDDDGPIIATVKLGLDNAATNVTVPFRFHLKNGNKYHLVLTYTSPLETFVKDIDILTSKIIIPPLYSDIEIPAENVTLIVDLPALSSFSNCNVDCKVEGMPLCQKIVAHFVHTCLFPTKNLEIEVKYLIFSTVVRPLLTLAILVIIGYAIYLKRSTVMRLIPREEKRKLTKSEEKAVTEFCQLQQEKVSLMIRKLSLKDQLYMQKISVKQYRDTVSKLTKRIDEIDRRIATLKPKLSSISSKFNSYFERIEAAEAEIDSAALALENARTRYIRHKLSKGAFMRLKQEYDKRIQNAIKTIDSIVFEIRHMAF